VLVRDITCIVEDHNSSVPTQYKHLQSYRTRNTLLSGLKVHVVLQTCTVPRSSCTFICMLEESNSARQQSILILRRHLVFFDPITWANAVCSRPVRRQRHAQAARPAHLSWERAQGATCHETVWNTAGSAAGGGPGHRASGRRRWARAGRGSRRTWPWPRESFSGRPLDQSLHRVPLKEKERAAREPHWNAKCTGLAQIVQVGPTFLLKSLLEACSMLAQKLANSVDLSHARAKRTRPPRPPRSDRPPRAACSAAAPVRKVPFYMCSLIQPPIQISI
jgi:hypothetical protein